MLTIAIVQLSHWVNSMNIAQRSWVRHQLPFSCHWDFCSAAIEDNIFLATWKCFVTKAVGGVHCPIKDDETWLTFNDTSQCPKQLRQQELTVMIGLAFGNSHADAADCVDWYWGGGAVGFTIGWCWGGFYYSWPCGFRPLLTWGSFGLLSWGGFRRWGWFRLLLRCAI